MPSITFPIVLVAFYVLKTYSKICSLSDIDCHPKDYRQSCPRTKKNTEDINLKKSVLDKHYNEEEMASGSGLNGLYRPRSALARALYEKQRNDGHLRDFDKNEWYRVEKEHLSPELLQKFVHLGPDQETKEFLTKCIEKSSWIWTQIWYLLAKTVLRHFWTVTDINGWLGRGSMFVLSESQMSALLSASGRETAHLTSVVDVGAGDGEVGRRFAGLFSERYATEISGSMRKILASKGYNVLDTAAWCCGRRFSCVCMLNLLDRCSRPRSMLRDARNALPSTGVLLIALVLPYKPYVEVSADHKPEERLPIEGETFEQQVSSFVSWMRLEGWELEVWARAPYLCEGDFTQSYYWLDDSVYLFSPTNNT